MSENWFGSWTWNKDFYGPTEIRTIKQENVTKISEFKVGTYQNHGRSLKIYKSGVLVDYFSDMINFTVQNSSSAQTAATV